MKTKIITTVFAILISGTMVYAQSNPKLSKKQSISTVKESPRDSVYYTCSRHPDIIRENPGLCPKCGLILEEKTYSKLKIKNNKKEQLKPYTCTMHPGISMNKPGICPKCGEPLVKKTSMTTATKSADKEIVKTYTCTMHPEVNKEYPGTCPVCGMELVEKKYSAAVK